MAYRLPGLYLKSAATGPESPVATLTMLTVPAIVQLVNTCNKEGYSTLIMIACINKEKAEMISGFLQQAIKRAVYTFCSLTEYSAHEEDIRLRDEYKNKFTPSDTTVARLRVHATVDDILNNVFKKEDVGANYYSALPRENGVLAAVARIDSYKTPIQILLTITFNDRSQ